MPTAYPYVRVSSWEQANRGYSLENQRAALAKYYAYRLKDQGFALGACFEDRAVSARKPLRDRLAGFRLNTTLEAGDVVLIVRTDRAFRNAADALNCMEAWQACGVFFLCAENGMTTEDPTGRMCVSMMAIGAQWENEVRKQRVKEVKDHRLRQGFWPFPRAPYGFKRVKVKGGWKLAPDPAQRQLASQFLAWRDQGWDLRKIWRHLLEKRQPALGSVEGWSPAAIWRWQRWEERLRQLEAAGTTPYGPYVLKESA